MYLLIFIVVVFLVEHFYSYNIRSVTFATLKFPPAKCLSFAHFHTIFINELFLKYVLGSGFSGTLLLTQFCKVLLIIYLTFINESFLLHFFLKILGSGFTGTLHYDSEPYTKYRRSKSK